jgi:hypothetical protein
LIIDHHLALIGGSCNATLVIVVDRDFGIRLCASRPAAALASVG